MTDKMEPQMVRQNNLDNFYQIYKHILKKMKKLFEMGKTKGDQLQQHQDEIRTKIIYFYLFFF